MEKEPKFGPIFGWNGGECPVNGEKYVKYWLRCGDSYIVEAYKLEWDHEGRVNDIIAYQVEVKPAAEKRSMGLVNDYTDWYASDLVTITRPYIFDLILEDGVPVRVENLRKNEVIK